MASQQVDLQENRRLMEAGELYWAFTPDLVADRRRSATACDRFNRASGDHSRRELAIMIKE